MSVVTIRTADDKEFKVSRDEIKGCGTLNDMIEELGTENPIPITTDAKYFEKVLELGKYRVEHPLITSEDKSSDKAADKKTREQDPWITKFSEVDDPTMFGCLVAANYLNNEEMLSIFTSKLANQIKEQCKDVSAQQAVLNIRKRFNIPDDITPLPTDDEETRKAKEEISAEINKNLEWVNNVKSETN